MLGQEYMRNALLAGGAIALAAGVCGWFVVLRRQVFAGDALAHVAFPGALAAATAGIDERVGLFAATVATGVMIALLGRGAIAVRGGRGAGVEAADDTAIGAVFTFVLALGVFFLTRFSLGSGSSTGIQAAHTLFGSIFGLSGGEARLAAAIAAAVLLAALAIGAAAAVRLGLTRGRRRAGACRRGCSASPSWLCSASSRRRPARRSARCCCSAC